MDKLFGQVDAVAAGEEEGSVDKIEAMTYTGYSLGEEKIPVVSHAENN
jgi:hypothetical protein